MRTLRLTKKRFQAYLLSDALRWTRRRPRLHVPDAHPPLKRVPVMMGEDAYDHVLSAASGSSCVDHVLRLMVPRPRLSSEYAWDYDPDA